MAFLNPKAVVDGQSMNVVQLLPSQYLIPNYQRDFAWGPKQITQLWADLVDHYRRVAPADSLTKPEGYFLGAMVTIEEAGTPELQVVDGQQRLTTLSILVIVLHEALGGYAAKHPQAGAIQYALKNCWVRYDGGSLLPFLGFSDPDTNQAFLDLCVKTTTRQARRGLWSGLPKKHQKTTSPYFALFSAFGVTYQELFAFLRNAKPANRSHRLVSFAQMVLECLVLLRIKASSYESAYAIFESLNDRGLRLSQADLVKNELLKVAAPSDRDDVIESWTNAKQVLSDTPIILSELLHYSCLHRHGEAKAQALFSFVKARLSQGLSAKSFATDLQEDAEALEQLLVQRPATWTANTLMMLDDVTKVIAVKFSYPMLLAVHRRFKSAPQDFERSIRLLMNFLFRFMKVGGGSPEKLALIAGKIGAHCRNASFDSKQALAAMSADFLLEASDKQFTDEFAIYSEANTKQAYFTVYYLERFLLNGTMPLPHGAESNLEHIMPKTPTVVDWPAAHALKASDPGQFNNLVWRIGNLLPLPESINKSIKNKGIAHKLSGGTMNYASSSLKSPNSLKAYLTPAGEWKDSSIEHRQKDLATIAPQVWSLVP